jgi:hypothetical protein
MEKVAATTVPENERFLITETVRVTKLAAILTTEGIKETLRVVETVVDGLLDTRL